MVESVRLVSIQLDSVIANRIVEIQLSNARAITLRRLGKLMCCIRKVSPIDVTSVHLIDLERTKHAQHLGLKNKQMCGFRQNTEVNTSVPREKVPLIGAD